MGEIHEELVSQPFTMDGIDIRVCAIGSGMTAEHTVDGLHPTLAGHAFLAENFAQFMSAQRLSDPDKRIHF